ncbi:unnamed protein product, partial [Musa hybrid cultivar]
IVVLLIRVIASYAWKQSQQDSHHFNHRNPLLVLLTRIPLHLNEVAVQRNNEPLSRILRSRNFI